MRLRVLVLLLVSISGSPALGADIGNVCVRQYSPGNECTGTDAWIARISPVSVAEDCPSGDPASAVATFELWVSAGTQSRYDIGLFVALNGGSALSGTSCLHDFLEPPFATSPIYADSDGNGRPDLRGGPWWNGEPFVPGDDCGDLSAGTDAIKTVVSFRFACADANANGIVDFSTCTSWSVGTNSTCPNLSGATPGGQTRCGCNLVDTGVPLTGAIVASGRTAALRVDRDGSGGLGLSWAPSCAATDSDYAVYEGTLGDFDSHQSALCNTGGASAATIPTPSGSVYYLVVPRGAQREGSYGSNSVGIARPPAANACAPQFAQDCS